MESFEQSVSDNNDVTIHRDRKVDTILRNLYPGVYKEVSRVTENNTYEIKLSVIANKVQQQYIFNCTFRENSSEFQSYGVGKITKVSPSIKNRIKPIDYNFGLFEQTSHKISNRKVKKRIARKVR